MTRIGTPLSSTLEFGVIRFGTPRNAPFLRIYFEGSVLNVTGIGVPGRSICEIGALAARAGGPRMLEESYAHGAGEAGEAVDLRPLQQKYGVHQWCEMSCFPSLLALTIFRIMPLATIMRFSTPFACFLLAYLAAVIFVATGASWHCACR